MDVRFDEAKSFHSSSPGPAPGDSTKEFEEWSAANRREPVPKSKRNGGGVWQPAKSAAGGSRRAKFSLVHRPPALPQRGYKISSLLPLFRFAFSFFLHVDNTSVSHPLLLGPPSNHQQLLTTLLSHQQENHFYSICPLLCSLKEPQIPPGLMIHILVSQQ